MSDQIADMAGIEGLTCDLAQLRSTLGDHVLELIAFRPPERGTPPLGAARVGEITAFDEGRSVYCREPAGSFFEMEEFRKAPAPDVEAGAASNAGARWP